MFAVALIIKPLSRGLTGALLQVKEAGSLLDETPDVHRHVDLRRESSEVAGGEACEDATIIA
jgi:hypothetical protein